MQNHSGTARGGTFRSIALAAQRALALPICLAALSLPGACAGGPQIVGGPEYPVRFQARTVDVHVVRDTTDVTLTNTSGGALPAGRMWVNAWFSRDFDALPVGATRTYNLFDFKDRFGVAFNGGGFFSTQRPDRLVQCQVATERETIGLVVIGE
ncbi:hypothetical protein BH11PLA1_BH11PLA1_20340 [soil metagenome]